MTVRELAPGARVTYRGEQLVLVRHVDGGAVSWLRHADDEHHTACLPSSWAVEAGEVIDRPRGAARPLRVETRDDVAAGGPPLTSRRGDGLGRDLSRRSPQGATPGGAELTFEDLVEYTVAIIVALLGGVGAIGWTIQHGLGVMTAVGAVVTSLGIAALRELRKARTNERPGEARAL